MIIGMTHKTIQKDKDLFGLLHQKKNQYMMDHGYNHQDHLTHYLQNQLFLHL